MFFSDVLITCCFFMQILSGLKTLLSQSPSLKLREAAAQFLGKCGSKEIPELYEVRMGIFKYFRF